MPLRHNSVAQLRPQEDRSLEEVYKRAVELNRQQRLDEAATLYETILMTRPDHFDARFRLGGVRYRQGRIADARECFIAAASSKPTDAVAWFNLAAVCLVMGHAEEALIFSDKALALKPDSAEALHVRGDALRALLRPREAVESYDKALALRPGYVEALNNCAVALADLGRFEEGLQNCDEAISLAPSSAALHNSRAVMLVSMERPAEAILSCDAALALSPGYVEALSNRGNALKALKRHGEALECYDRALALEPESAEVLNNRGLVLAELHRAEEGLASIEKALALKPGYSNVYANQSVLLSELGRLDEASSAIRRAIRLNPGRAVLYHTLTESCRLAPDDPLIEAMKGLAKNMTSLDVKEQVFLQFALATALADTDCQQSFEHLRAGNALKRKQTAYNEEAVLGAMERTRDLLTGDLIQSNGGLGDPSCAPVFIVGMPRSGSTLIEQILASHPGVFGAGEIDLFPATLAEFRGQGATGVQFPDAVPKLSGEHFRQIGADYVGRLNRLAPAAERITDKMLDNFRFAGLIHLALPNARIIHARRDPLDTCFSCFSKLFVDGLSYTYNLSELGRYYCAYEALMAHWRKVLPNGVMLEVQYEDLVGDCERQARRIIAHCGLEWDTRCLDFHATERQVRTASKAQVRQPLYKNAIGRARKSEAHLAPLLDALQPPLANFSKDSSRSRRS